MAARTTASGRIGVSAAFPAATTPPSAFPAAASIAPRLTSNVSASIPSYLTIGYDTTGSLTATAPFNLSVGTAFYVGGGTSSVGNGTLNIGTLGSTDGTITTSIFDAGYSTGSTGAIIQNGGLVQLIGTSTGYLALGGGSLSGFSSNSTGMAGTGSYTLNGGTLTSACSPNRGTFMIGLRHRRHGHVRPVRRIGPIHRLRPHGHRILRQRLL